MTTRPAPVETADRPAADETSVSVRIEALREFAAAAEPYLPAEQVAPAHEVVAHGTQRLALSRDHTVVALAGATGGGKSSLFNALAGRELSPVGVHRPTTGEAYACVWGPLEEAADLLDWLKVAPAHRYTRESPLDGDDEAQLRGLVLLDLPDFDSLETGHATEVRRLLSQVDLVVWVMDPQKYADRVVHEQHLSAFQHHQQVTVVALNQADLVSAADLDRLLDDLRRLLGEDGLDGIPAVATSAVDTPSGLAQLRARLAAAATGGAALARVSADVDRAAATLAGLVGDAAVAADDPVILHELTHGLARVAGAAAAVEVAAAMHRRRGTELTNWTLLRWLGRLRPDPLRHLTAPELPAVPSVGQHPAPAQDVGQQAGAGLVVREVARRATEGLPAPWREAALSAARSRVDELPGALEGALASVDLDAIHTPAWWRLANAVQWLAVAAAVTGAILLAGQWLLRLADWPVPLAGVGPVLLGGGLLTGLLLAVITQPLVRRSARLARDRVAGQLRVVIGAVGQDHVVIPIQAVLRAYARARQALAVIAR